MSYGDDSLTRRVSTFAERSGQSLQVTLALVYSRLRMHLQKWPTRYLEMQARVYEKSSPWEASHN
ncbi:hypothetical protein ACFR9U_16230 [Halorientalis brevis]|uniref:Uncharacterized protein n=1 Tax=Halorientalis brevis TaxID=1126241 RepID=A0ABD6CE12_9EURY|nr:hypothetical protein [Halorientalis brevis]